MRKLLSRSILLTAAVGLCATGSRSTEPAAPQLAHMVFFTLKDPTEANRDKLIAACEKHLSKHDGTVYFSVGTIVDDLKREVNDREFDVALHLVFKDRAAHDAYQTHPRHLSFIEENQALWGKVRVFDSYIGAH